MQKRRTNTNTTNNNNNDNDNDNDNDNTNHKNNMDNKETTQIQDIEELHNLAILQKSNTYIDPPTGFTVLTEYSHLKRGKCCGNKCRHCPYGWENVKYKQQQQQNTKDNSTTTVMVGKVAKVQSGDKEGVQKLLEQIESGIIPQVPTSSSCCDATTITNSDSNTCQTDTIKKSLSTSTSTSKTKSKGSGKGGRHGGTLTSKNVPYTRSGDKGTSILITGERRSKDDLAFEAMGTVDELCSIVGTVHAELSLGIEERSEQYDDLDSWLLDVMSRLFDIGSHIAKPKKAPRRKEQEEEDSSDDDDDDDDSVVFIPDGIGGGFDIEHVHILEEWIDTMTEELPELNSFILPTGGRASAQLHVARTVCRRAERRVLPLVQQKVSDPNAMQYLNRLSDFFFTAARYTNFCEGRDEIGYKRHFRGDTQRNLVSVKLRDEKKTSS